MNTEETRKVLVRAFPAWLSSLLKCVPVRITERKIVLMVSEGGPGEHIRERVEQIAGRLTGRKVEFESAPDREVSSQAVLDAASRNLIDWFARLEVMFELIRDKQAKAADLAPRINTDIAMLSMLSGGVVEAHRGGHPAWLEVTGIRHDSDRWALTLNADGILWPSLYVGDASLRTIVRKLSSNPPVISGKEVRAFGLPESVESADSFTLSFPRM